MTKKSKIRILLFAFVTVVMIPFLTVMASELSRDSFSLSGDWKAKFSNQDVKNRLVPIEDSNQYTSYLTSSLEYEIMSFQVDYTLEAAAGITEIYLFKDTNLLSSDTILNVQYYTSEDRDVTIEHNESQSFNLKNVDGYTEGETITKAILEYSVAEGELFTDPVEELPLVTFNMWNPEAKDGSGTITQHITSLSYMKDGQVYYEEDAGFDINDDYNLSDTFVSPSSMAIGQLENSSEIVLESSLDKESYIPKESGVYKISTYNNGEGNLGETIVDIAIPKKGDGNSSPFSMFLNGMVILTGKDFASTSTSVQYSVDGNTWLNLTDNYSEISFVRIFSQGNSVGVTNKIEIPFKVDDLIDNQEASLDASVVTKVSYTKDSDDAINIEDAKTIQVQRVELQGTISVEKSSTFAGDILTASPNLTNSIVPGELASTYNWQWYRGDELVEGASGNSYMLTAEDYEKDIRVQITGTGNYYGNVEATITMGVIISGEVAISGTPMAKKTLIADIESITPAGTPLEYQWYSNGEAIDGANSKEYKLTLDDIGSLIHVSVYGAGLNTGKISSEEMGPIHEPTPEIKVVGDKIIVENNESDLFKITYQWTGETEIGYSDWGEFEKRSNFITQWSNISAANKELETFGGVGWYTVLAFYKNDNKVFITETLYVDESNINSKGFTISYTDEKNLMGNTNQYLYYYAGEENSCVYNWGQFQAKSNKKYETVKLYQPTKSFDFKVEQTGWYTVCVMAENGNRYYNVYVELSEDEGYNRPKLQIVDKTITAYDSEPAITLIEYIKGIAENPGEFNRLFEEGEIEKGLSDTNGVTVEGFGDYSLRITNELGQVYYFKTIITEGPELNYDNLNNTITEAEDLIANPQISINGKHDENGKIMEVRSDYTNKEALDSLFAEIARVKALTGNFSRQSDIDKAQESLQQVIKAYNSSLKKVAIGFVSSNEDNISIGAPKELGGKITKILYRSNVEKTGLQGGILHNWTVFSASTSVTAQKSSLEFENVPGGIYSFLVFYQTDDGVTTSYYEDVVVSDSNNMILSATMTLLDMIAESYDLLNEYPNVTGKNYDLLYGAIIKATKIVQNIEGNYNFNNYISAGRNLASAITSFKKSVEAVEPVPFAEHDLHTIEANNGNFIVSSKDTNGENDLISVAYAKGTYDKWLTFREADYTSIAANGKDVEFSVAYNEEYTVLMKYRDGTSEYKQITVTDIYLPFAIEEMDGYLKLTNRDEDITRIGYSYGENLDSFSEDFIWTDLDLEKISLPILDNGIHTVCVLMEDGAVYYDTIMISSLTSPVMLESDTDTLTIIDYTWDLTTGAYIKGDYQTWEEVRDSATYISPSIPFDCSKMEAGKYTFFLWGKDGRQYRLVYDYQKEV